MCIEDIDTAIMTRRIVGKARPEYGREAAREDRTKPRMGHTTDTRQEGTMDRNSKTNGETRKHRVQQVL